MAKNSSRPDLSVEYEVCSREIIGIVNNYWTSASIFVGVTTAVLAGLAYAVLANDKLLQSLISTNTFQASGQVQLLRAIVSFLGVTSVTILTLLLFWLRRLYFVQDVFHFRMRQIEGVLTMWKSRLVHYVDQWEEDMPKSSREDFLITLA